MVIKYGKPWNPPVGMSSNAVFLKGNKGWTDGLAKLIESALPDITILISNKVHMTEWDIRAATTTDFFSINFTDLDGENLWLIRMAEKCKFPPTILVYDNLYSRILGEDFDVVDDMGNVVEKIKSVFSLDGS